MRSIHDWVLRSRLSSRGGRHKMNVACDSSAIALVHFADKYSARAGETVRFTAWILNDSKGAINEVFLIQRSFTNAKREKLTYTTAPSPHDLRIPHMDPGESRQLEFTYVVRQTDIAPGGQIVSALEVRATSSCGVHWDGCYTSVHVRGSHKGSWSP